MLLSVSFSIPVIRDRSRPILLKKSLRDFCSRKGVVDVEMWLAQKAELSWFLRSNAKFECFLNC
jgi:hypothetical protein